MDIKEFQDSRKSKLAEFQLKYNASKLEYSNTLKSAISEQDDQKQKDLIQKVLGLNSDMSSELRDILGELNKGSTSFDAKTLDQLTKDLVEYQKQYDEISKAKDQVQSLKLIQASTAQNLEQANSMFTMYLIALVSLCVLSILLAFWGSAMAIITNMVSSVKSTIGLQQ